MRIIEEYISGPMFSSPIFDEYFGGMNIVVADIETTGLSPKSAVVILGGAVFAENGARKAIQFFGDTIDDEKELLERYTALLERADVIVTYNGQRFDIPFLLNRMKRHELDTSGMERLYSLDIYRVLRYHSHLPEILPNMKQKTVEIFLGDSDSRTDEIDGAQSVELYYEYVNSSGAKRAQLLDSILLHNRDDIVRLSDMMRILRTLDIHEIMYSLGFPLAAGESIIHTEKIKMLKGRMSVQGQVMGDTADYTCFSDGFVLSVSGKDGKLKLDIECENVDDYTVSDLRILGMDDEGLQKLGGYESGYLILREGKEARCHEINMLVKKLLQKYLS